MRDRSFISCILSISLFPPLSVQTTVLPFISSLYKSSAAIESAPAGSATIAFSYTVLKSSYKPFPLVLKQCHQLHLYKFQMLTFLPF